MRIVLYTTTRLLQRKGFQKEIEIFLAISIWETAESEIFADPK